MAALLATSGEQERPPSGVVHTERLRVRAPPSSENLLGLRASRLNIRYHYRAVPPTPTGAQPEQSSATSVFSCGFSKRGQHGRTNWDDLSRIKGGTGSASRVVAGMTRGEEAGGGELKPVEYTVAVLVQTVC